MKSPWYHLFELRHNFAQPVVFWITIVLAAALGLTPLIFVVLQQAGKVDAKLSTELWKRYFSWLVMVPLLLLPVLLGPVWTIAGSALLGLFCYREFAGVTGIRRELSVHVPVLIGIAALTFAAFDHWYNFMMALFPLTITVIAAATILVDRPQGYLQRVALGIAGFMLFGGAWAHVGFLANDPLYCGYIILLLVSVQLNDIFAYICGKTFGQRKLCPQTSPNKTIGGAVGAVVLTTIVTFLLGKCVFAGTPLAKPGALIALGVLLSCAGQFGDLMLSSIKRDLGIKDMGDLIPGHGGLLDRFDSVLLAAPVFFHLINYYIGVAVDQPARILSSGW